MSSKRGLARAAGGLLLALVAAPSSALAQQPPPTEPGAPAPAAAPPAESAAQRPAAFPPAWPVRARAPEAPVTLDLAVHLGPTVRLNDSQYFDSTGRAGVVVGAGVAVAFTPRVSLGLSYEHTTLGTEAGALGALPDEATFSVVRSLDAAWAVLRVFPWHGEGGGFFLQLGPGLAWQSVKADGQVSPGMGQVPVATQCAATDAAGFGLRVGLGGEVALGGNLWFVADASFDNLHLSSDVVDSCVPGAGSVNLLGLRGAFAYRFDVTRAAR